MAHENISLEALVEVSALIVSFLQMQTEGVQQRGVALGVTPQQAAVVSEHGACINYSIICPPTLSLTAGEIMDQLN